MTIKTFDLRQSSLFGDDTVAEPTARSERVCDRSRLRITEHDGEGYISATDACAAISYGQVAHFREFIKRLDKTEMWGGLSYRTINPTQKGGRPGIEPLLTEKQLVIVYMRCDLPNMAEVRSLIADVFISWKNGKLKPSDAATETALLDATDRAVDTAPDAMSLLVDVNKKLDRLSEYLRKMQRSFDENVRQPRADELSSVRWQQDYVVAEHLDCWCPICRKTKILIVTERSADERVSKVEKTDHYEHAHLWVRTIRGIFNTMPMCRKCNQTWEKKLRHYQWVYERVRSFHRLLQEVWGILDLEDDNGR